MKKYTQDAFKNLVTGLGTTKDRFTAGEWETYTYNGNELAAAYTCDWLVQQLVNIPADEATRKWRTITTPSMTPEQIELFEQHETKLKVKNRVRAALKWSSLFGGSGIYIVVDGQAADEELIIDMVRQGAALNFIALDRNNITAATVYSDENDPEFLMPASYTSNISTQLIDATRFIRFEGRELPKEQWESNNYWGLSDIGAVLPEVSRCQTVSHAITQLIDEANVDTISVENLFAKLANAQSTASLRARFAEGEAVKTLYNIQLLDSKEEYHRHELASSLTGLTSILAAFYEKPAAALGIPITKLLGVSPGGLNATGESDLENFYDRIDTIRTGPVADALVTTDALMNQSLFGRQFDDWSYDWDPLWQMSELEQSQVTTARIDNMIKLHSSGLLSSAIVVRQLHEDGTFNAIDESYVKDVEALEEMDPEPVEPPVQETDEENDEEDGERPE